MSLLRPNGAGVQQGWPLSAKLVSFRVVEGLLSSVSIVLVLGVCEYVFSGSIIDCL